MNSNRGDDRRDKATEREKRLTRSGLGAGDSDPTRTRVAGTMMDPLAEPAPREGGGRSEHPGAPNPPATPPHADAAPGVDLAKTSSRDAAGGGDEVARNQGSMGRRNTPPETKPIG